MPEHPVGYDRGSTHPSQGNRAPERGALELRGMKECPLCGEPMRLHSREVPERPGLQSAAKVLREWVCPECDYYEEAEAGEE